MDQLRRMREMQYAYHKKFFHGLYFFLVLVITCLFWDSPLSFRKPGSMLAENSKYFQCLAADIQARLLHMAHDLARRQK